MHVPCRSVTPPCGGTSAFSCPSQLNHRRATQARVLAEKICSRNLGHDRPPKYLTTERNLPQVLLAAKKPTKKAAQKQAIWATRKQNKKATRNQTTKATQNQTKKATQNQTKKTTQKQAK